MAVKTFTTAMTGGNLVVTWAAMAAGDTGDPFLNPAFMRLSSVQYRATFGNSTFTLEGSNDGSNYVTLADPQGNALSKTANGIEAVLEGVLYYRPAFSVTTGSACVAVMVFTALTPA